MLIVSNCCEREREASSLLKKSRLLSASYGVCDKARSEGNVGDLVEEGNEAHRPRMARLAGGSGVRAACVGPLDKVTDIAFETRLVSPHARTSELSRLFQQAANVPFDQIDRTAS